jgi:ketosteroid isomerase-like protein
MKNEDEAGIKLVLDRLAEGWRKADAKLLKNVFDQEYRDASLLAPENNRPTFGRAAINEYFEKITANFPDVKVEFKNIKIVPLAGLEGVAHVFFDSFNYIRMPDYGKKSEIFVAKEWFVRSRLTLVMRKRGDEWYIIHYHESVPWMPPVGGKWEEPL